MTKHSNGLRAQNRHISVRQRLLSHGLGTRATNLVRLLEEQDEIAARDMLFFFYKFSDRPACIHLFCNQIHTRQFQGLSCIFGQIFLAKWP